jgi:putative endonuclease
MSKTGYAYIMASRKHGTIYVGVTSDIRKRSFEHREGLHAGFTKNHGVKRLVHLETFDEIADAIAREKQLKNWKRKWKVELIEKENPEWVDLYSNLF